MSVRNALAGTTDELGNRFETLLDVVVSRAKRFLVRLYQKEIAGEEEDRLMRELKAGPLKVRCEKGVTVLEVMVSILILTIGALGLAPLIGTTVNNNPYASDLTIADTIAQQELESLIAQKTYGALPMMDTRDLVSGSYQVNRRVEDNTALASVPPGVYKLSVNIKWVDSKQKIRSIDYSVFKPKSKGNS